MKKQSLVLFLVFIAAFANAQHDSLKKIRISAIQAEIGPGLYMGYKELQQQDYQTITKNDPFVNADLSGYQKDGWYSYDGAVFNGLAGVKVYAEIKSPKKIKKEVFIGIKYGREGDMGIGYSKKAKDTTAIYTDSYTGRKIYEIRELTSNYGYSIASQKLIVPLGFSFTTNKDKFFWVTFGVELSPVLNFNYILTSSSRTTTDTELWEDGTIYNSNTNNFPIGNQQVKENKTKLSGVGYGLYAALPFSMYLHPFKKMAFLKHLNVLASISPLYMYSNNKYYGANSRGTLSLATGLRYNW